jgi:hypothetical protein
MYDYLAIETESMRKWHYINPARDFDQWPEQGESFLSKASSALSQRQLFVRDSYKVASQHPRLQIAVSQT